MNPYDIMGRHHMGCKSPGIGAISAAATSGTVFGSNWDLWRLPGPTFVPQSRLVLCVVGPVGQLCSSSFRFGPHGSLWQRRQPRQCRRSLLFSMPHSFDLETAMV